MKRRLVCPCGHPMQAANDEDLYKIVRDHVDEQHPERNFSRDDIMKLIKQEAEDI